MKKLISLALALVMLLSMAAMAETIDSSVISTDEKAASLGIPAAVQLRETDALQGKKLGNSICYKGDEWCAALANALEALGAYYGADITVEDGDLVDETQIKQIENMMANGVDMIMVDPVSTDGEGEALNQAYEAGIPLIIYDGHWTEGAEKALTTVTWDQVETGRIVASYFLDYIREHNDGKATLIELTNAVAAHCQERWVGVNEVFDAADDCEVTVVGMYDTQGNRETAEKAVSAVVQPYDYIISDVDNGAMGALSALQQVGNTDVKVFSMGAYGAEPFGLLHDNDPNYTACLNVDAWVLAQFIFDAAIDYYEGNDVPELTNIDLFMVDHDNIEDFWTF